MACTSIFEKYLCVILDVGLMYKHPENYYWAQNSGGLCRADLSELELKKMGLVT